MGFDIFLVLAGVIVGGTIMYFIQPKTKVITEATIADEQRAYDFLKSRNKTPPTPPTPSL